MSTPTSDPNAPPKHHKRTATSVLKTLMTPRAHKRNPSAGDALPAQVSNENRDPRTSVDSSKRLPCLPLDHPQLGPRPLGELSQDRMRSPIRPHDFHDPQEELPSARRHEHEHEPHGSPRKLIPSTRPDRDARGRPGKDEGEKAKKPKKSKSHTSLSTLLSRPKSSKGRDAPERETREERPPPSTRAAAPVPPPPIYAQFTSQALLEPARAGDACSREQRIQQEIEQYTPVEYSPSKQRNFRFEQPPTLGKRPQAPKARPKSDYLPSYSSSSVVRNVISGLRKASDDSSRPSVSSRGSAEHQRRPHSPRGGQPPAAHHAVLRKSSDDVFRTPGEERTEGLAVAKRGSRVMAAVATFNQRARAAQAPAAAGSRPALDPKAIESSFEALLDSRNVPQNMRDKLRSLDTRIKADFVQKDHAANAVGTSLLSPTPATSSIEPGPVVPKDPPVERRTTSEETTASSSPSKRSRSRPRSRAFTFSKSTEKDGSANKKQKSERGGRSRSRSRAGRPKSSEWTAATNLAASSSKSVTSLHHSAEAVVTAEVGQHRPAPPVPPDFVSYLREERDPRAVEVGKLHKLRLVLRNERVAWVDSFIAMGGMAEVIGLLGRIMGIEWREEHEDALLHETLLCLKALCTTALALRELHDVQATLFPALIGMLFDEERKGPSEFTTRGIIIGLLLTYLASVQGGSAADPDQAGLRAGTLLAQLRDPAPAKDHFQPLHFIASMHQSRPYRVWCKEIASVTKEVFWIFLHQQNTIPLTYAASSSSSSYAAQHFPTARPPVPAAPYVGGVEWDATNYMTAHLDLLNGLLASLPTRAARNALRRDLRLSGLERVMGASLRTCKEKFYGGVHDALKTWVAAAQADEWPVADVRFGPSSASSSAADAASDRPALPLTPRNSPPKKSAAPMLPKVLLPPLQDLGAPMTVGVLGGGGGGGGDGSGGDRGGKENEKGKAARADPPGGDDWFY
ncbi:MAG: hypothetical protein M1826_005619 [Phylliscum demangeonii]|nr:MAG: hypothetical protein M1826_005619 [Phylliscum demangeonii]